MPEPMPDERIAKIKAHLAYADEDGRTMGDIYARELLAEVERLRQEAANLNATIALVGSSLKVVGEHTETITAQRDQLMTLVRDLADPDECWFDHHGGCQAHGYLNLGPGELCPHAEAKELLATIDKTKAPGT